MAYVHSRWAIMFDSRVYVSMLKCKPVLALNVTVD